MSAVSIRRAGPGDAARLALVGAATFLETFADTIDGDAILAHCATEHAPAVYARWLDGGAGLWLAETADMASPVGYAALTEPELPPALVEPGDAEVKRIYLLSRFHGAGAGKALMAEAIAAAGAAGKRRLLLGCYRGNDRAIGFYRAQGFQAVGERRFQVGPNLYDDLVMARPL